MQRALWALGPYSLAKPRYRHTKQIPRIYRMEMVELEYACAGKHNGLSPSQGVYHPTRGLFSQPRGSVTKLHGVMYKYGILNINKRFAGLDGRPSRKPRPMAPRPQLKY